MDFYEKLFHNSIIENNLDSIKYCLSKGVNPNKINFSGRTAIGLAAEHGNFEIFCVLLENQKESIKTLSDRDTKLSLNLSSNNNKNKNIGYFVVCKDAEENELGEGPTPEGMEGLEWDMEINNENSEEECLSSTPPEAKIYKWYADILNRSAIILQSPENDVARIDKFGQNALHYAVIKGHCDIVEYLLDNYKEFCVNQTTADMLSPLHIASFNGNLGMVKLLIRRRANLELTNRQRQTALHVAAKKGYLDIINLLIENGANINSGDLEDRSPLSVAIVHNQTEASILLIKAGTRLNTENTNGITILQQAVWKNNVELVRVLLSFGAKIIQSNFLLHWAIQIQNMEMFKLLHQYGAILNIKNENNLTPVMFCCRLGRLPFLKYLLENGASPNARNDLSGLSPLHICVEYIRDKIRIKQFLDLLIQYNVDINVESTMGNVFYYALLHSNLEAACLLVKYGIDVSAKKGNYLFNSLYDPGEIELFRLLVFAGVNYNLLINTEYLKMQNDEPMLNLITQVNSNPLDLASLCRIRIRHFLIKQKCKSNNKNIMHKIYQLPLPTVLLHYLALERL